MLRVVVSACNPSTKDAEAGELRLETILGYRTWSSLKKQTNL